MYNSVTNYDLWFSDCQVFWWIQIHEYKGSLLKVAFINNNPSETKPFRIHTEEWLTQKISTMIHLSALENENFKATM